MQVNLKTQYHKNEPRNKYVRCSDEQRFKYNQTLNNTKPTDRDNISIIKWIKEAAEAEMTEQLVTRHPFELSEDTRKKMENKKKLIQSGANDTEVSELRKAVTRAVRSDKRRYSVNMVSHEIDTRDQ